MWTWASDQPGGPRLSVFTRREWPDSGQSFSAAKYWSSFICIGKDQHTQWCDASRLNKLHKVGWIIGVNLRTIKSVRDRRSLNKQQFFTTLWRFTHTADLVLQLAHLLSAVVKNSAGNTSCHSQEFSTQHISVPCENSIKPNTRTSNLFVYLEKN